jgi:hypothetical protein
MDAQNAQNWTASIVIGIEPTSRAERYLRVRRTEGLLRSVIDAVVQVPVAGRTPP